MDLDPTHLQEIAKESGASPKQVASTLDLLEKRSAIPFIARYRKEVTGNLDEPRIRRIAEGHGRHRALLKRQRVILARIEDQGKLTEALRDRILACKDRTGLEDLYSPFKRKESKEATAAGEKGLEPLAKRLWGQETGEFSVEAAADEFLSEEKAVATREEALEGALAIVAGWVADDAAIRGALRELMAADGMLVSKVVEGKEGEKSKYESFYDFRQEVSRLPFRRLTVLRHGAREGFLTLEIELDDPKALRLIRDKAIRQADSPCVPHLEKAIRNAWFDSLKPLLQAEVRSHLKKKSDDEALKLFQANLANLLLAPPVGFGSGHGNRPRSPAGLQNSGHRRKGGLPRARHLGSRLAAEKQRSGRGHPLPAHPTARNPCHRHRQWRRGTGNRAFRQEFPGQVSFRAFLRSLSGPRKAGQVRVSRQKGRKSQRPGGKRAIRPGRRQPACGNRGCGEGQSSPGRFAFSLRRERSHGGVGPGPAERRSGT